MFRRRWPSERGWGGQERRGRPRHEQHGWYEEEPQGPPQGEHDGQYERQDWRDRGRQGPPQGGQHGMHARRGGPEGPQRPPFGGRHGMDARRGGPERPQRLPFGDRHGWGGRRDWQEGQQGPARDERHGRFEHRGRGHGFGARIWGWQARRNFFGPEGPFGPRGPFGPGGPGGSDDGFPGFPGGKRFFGRGDLKFALLELLEERPMHGYEMMKALQDRSGGRYNASPGSIYPTLQMLEDRGFVTSDTADGKKVYTITEAGKTFAHEQGNQERGPRRHRHERDDEMVAIMREFREFGPLLAQAVGQAYQDPSKRTRLRELIERLRGELAEIVAPTEMV